MSFGGGTILNMGVYTIQMVCLAFGHEKPNRITAVGHLNEDRVDFCMSALLTYPGNRTATMLTHSALQLSNKAYIVGSKGSITIPSMWCPSQIKLPSGTRELPLPPVPQNLNYTNSIGFVYEAAEVRECLKKGEFPQD